MTKKRILSYKSYINDICNFDKVVSEIRTKSTEAYFGKDNPLRIGLLSWVEKTKAKCEEIYEENPDTKNSELIKKIEPLTKELEDLITKEFNISGCRIGYVNEINSYAYAQIFNKKIFNDSALRKRLTDVVETKNGFKYKDPTGIYYVICLGIPFFKPPHINKRNNDFKDFEIDTEIIGSIIVHELGHCMQQVITGINSQYGIIMYKELLFSKGVLKKEDKKLLELFKRTRNDPKEFERVSANYMKPYFEKGSKEQKTVTKEIIDFSKVSGKDITDQNNKYDKLDDVITIYTGKEKNKVGFFTRLGIGIGDFFKSLFTFVFSFIYVPYIAYKMKKMGKSEYDNVKIFENTADTFASYYGFGDTIVKVEPYLKMLSGIKNDKMEDNKYVSLIAKIPLLDVLRSTDRLKDDWFYLSAGYPIPEQRITNQFIALNYELEHNKDLSEKDKEEIKEQMEEITTVYNDYVRGSKASCGFWYKVLAGLGRKSIKDMAYKDNSIVKTVLEPFRNIKKE